MMMPSFAAGHAGDPRGFVIIAPGWVHTDMDGPKAPLGVEDSILASWTPSPARQESLVCVFWTAGAARFDGDQPSLGAKAPHVNSLPVRLQCVVTSGERV